MAWHRSGNKPLSESIMVSLLMHICISRPQWVKEDANDFIYDFFIFVAVNTLRHKQIGYSFADDIIKLCVCYKNCCLLIQNSFKYVLNVPSNSMPALVQVMALCQCLVYWHIYTSFSFNELNSIHIDLRLNELRSEWHFYDLRTHKSQLTPLCAPYYGKILLIMRIYPDTCQMSNPLISILFVGKRWGKKEMLT